ncbi:Crocetin glucosyltransferase, chloroplastic [Dichanthelium oligosanthes]|uniref:Glycosyltransferase n=1 Tax=Dichanthelium oligosanthes TaxID=888268 RepID=A0A1E5V145_9POAL|nr:Crocetin glucosyltransferase, chloroplastic [Dichanthelium oligosanthes]
METPPPPPPPPPQQHFLFVTNPMQGHLAPARRLAARVMALNPDARVTFSTAVSGHRRMFPSLASPDGETVDAAGVLHVPHSDGFDDGFNPAVHGAGTYRARATAAGRDTLSAVVSRLASRGRPVTCLVYTFLVPWVPDVARDHGVPAALFWIQPAAVFAVYYRYFHGHDAALAVCANGADPAATVCLPGLPPLRPDALPSAVGITSPEHRHYLLLDLVRDLFMSLDEHRPRVLVNTFDALEPDALRAVPEFELAAVGPVVPDDDASPSSADLLHRPDAKVAYMEWLDAKPARSVVYVSFGSIFSIRDQQEEEMRRGLEATGRPYLWVARKAAADGRASQDSSSSSAGDGDAARGLVVEWCDQVRVLSHPAVGCFVTHCGWNSTLESVTRGVPMVAVPQWTDQPTVAWLVEARMGAGARARVDGEGVVDRAELRRCVETAMGDGEAAAAIRAQSDRWRELASEAVAPGGTSERNLRAFASAAAAAAANDA